MEEIKHLYEHENAIIVFDDFSGSANNRDIDQLFNRGRHNNSDV